jgi:hypothetical protein
MMGITSNDIAAQRAMLQRGDEKRKAARQAKERELLRDTFAAAALTGFIRGMPSDSIFHRGLMAQQSYEVADAMLRERLCTLATHATPSEGSVQDRCTLTDAEREAIECGIQAIGLAPCDERTLAHADRLRGLLERLK